MSRLLHDALPILRLSFVAKARRRRPLCSLSFLLQILLQIRARIAVQALGATLRGYGWRVGAHDRLAAAFLRSPVQALAQLDLVSTQQNFGPRASPSYVDAGALRALGYVLKAHSHAALVRCAAPMSVPYHGMA